MLPPNGDPVILPLLRYPRKGMPKLKAAEALIKKTHPEPVDLTNKSPNRVHIYARRGWIPTPAEGDKVTD